MAEGGLIKVPKFLKRLHRETSDPLNVDIIWNDGGDRIKIVDKDAFIRNTLPSLSKTKEYSAFIRQLNIYGFVKMKNEKNDDAEEYYNTFFRRDQPNLMGFMKRICKNSKSDVQLNWPSLENSITFLSNSNYRLTNEVAELKTRVDKQEQTINGLLDILGRVFRNGLQNLQFDQQNSQKVVDKPFEYPLAIPTKPFGDLEQAAEVGIEEKDQKRVEGSDSPKEPGFPDMNDIFF